jgi:hypothetical protein
LNTEKRVRLPLTISKKELCIALGLYAKNSGRCYYDKLRKHFLTNEILSKLEIKPTDFDRRGAYTFSALHTRRLFEAIEELRELDF